MIKTGERTPWTSQWDNPSQGWIEGGAWDSRQRPLYLNSGGRKIWPRIQFWEPTVNFTVPWAVIKTTSLTYPLSKSTVRLGNKRTINIVTKIPPCICKGQYQVFVIPKLCPVSKSLKS